MLVYAGASVCVCVWGGGGGGGGRFAPRIVSTDKILRFTNKTNIYWDGIEGGGSGV